MTADILDNIIEKRKKNLTLVGVEMGISVPKERRRPVTPFLPDKGVLLEIKKASPPSRIILSISSSLNDLTLSSLLFAIQRLYHDKKSFKKNSIKIFVSIDRNRNQGYVSSCRIVSICRNDSQRSFYAEKDRQHISFSAK